MRECKSKNTHSDSSQCSKLNRWMRKIKFSVRFYIVSIIWCMFDANHSSNISNNDNKNTTFLSPNVQNFIFSLSLVAWQFNYYYYRINRRFWLYRSIDFSLRLFFFCVVAISFILHPIWFITRFGCKWMNRVCIFGPVCEFVFVCAVVCWLGDGCFCCFLLNFFFAQTWKWHNSVISDDCYNKFYHWNDT